MSDPVDLRLSSPFREPYDHHFAGSWRTDLPLWRRDPVATRTRREDHALLAEAPRSALRRSSTKRS